MEPCWTSLKLKCLNGSKSLQARAKIQWRAWSNSRGAFYTSSFMGLVPVETRLCLTGHVLHPGSHLSSEQLQPSLLRAMKNPQQLAEGPRGQSEDFIPPLELFLLL